MHSHGHRQKCSEGQREVWVEGGKGEKMGDICNNVDNKKTPQKHIVLKKEKIQEHF